MSSKSAFMLSLAVLCAAGAAVGLDAIHGSNPGVSPAIAPPTQADGSNIGPQGWQDPNNRVSADHNLPTDAPIAKNPLEDPYADGQRAVLRTKYELLKDEALKKIEVANWAYKCQVISNVDAFQIGTTATRVLLGPGGVNTTDPDLNGDIARAAHQGAEKSKTSGCNYWLGDPEAVSQIREEVQYWSP